VSTKQSAAVRPEPTLQRKAAIAHGAARDHAGSVRVEPIPDFDLDRTIFQTLEGAAARYVMRTRIAKEVHWAPEAAAPVQAAYDRACALRPLPPVSPDLLRFLVEQCDFDVEHADGSFLDHLYFCYEYAVQHYPQRSPLVMLLHSILGTGTNTFAMTADKIDALRPLLTPFEWAHTEAFPSVLRLLYAGGVRAELRQAAGRAGALQSIRMHRVIDNAPITMSGEDLWIALNYQLIHLVDFLPVANWAAHANDTSFIVFRDLHDLLVRAGRLEAKVDYTPASGPRSVTGERSDVGAWLVRQIPVGLSEAMAAKSIARFSKRIGHSLDFTLTWA
jgi:hypothetical protein